MNGIEHEENEVDTQIGNQHDEEVDLSENGNHMNGDSTGTETKFSSNPDHRDDTEYESDEYDEAAQLIPIHQQFPFLDTNHWNTIVSTWDDIVNEILRVSSWLYAIFATFTSPAQASFIAFFLAYLLCFSFQTHVILACLFIGAGYGTISVMRNTQSLIDHQGIVWLVPNRWRPYLEDYTILEMVNLFWSSHSMLDLMTLLFFRLTPEEQRAIMRRLPKTIQQSLTHRGVVTLLPNSIQSHYYPQILPATADSANLQPSADISVQLLMLPDSEILSETSDSDSDMECEFTISQIQTVETLHVCEALVPKHVSKSNVNFWTVADRSIQLSLSSFFHIWAHQCYNALFESLVEILGISTFRLSSFVLFVPLAFGMACLQGSLDIKSERFRSMLRQRTPLLVDLVVYFSALRSVLYLYRELISSSPIFGKNRLTHGSKPHDEDGRIPQNTLKLYSIFLWRKLKQQLGIHFNVVIFALWILYISNGRQRLVQIR